MTPVSKTAYEQLLNEALSYEAETFEDEDASLNGADLVDWFCEWRARVVAAKAADTGEHVVSTRKHTRSDEITAHLDTLPLDRALWWFIENATDDSPWRTDVFFHLRERVRT